MRLQALPRCILGIRAFSPNHVITSPVTGCSIVRQGEEKIFALKINDKKNLVMGLLLGALVTGISGTTRNGSS
ncbi:MAG: hypothetical protein M3A44_10815 [Gammaproteobacteria bacterium]